MIVGEAVRQSFATLRLHRMRTFLTLFGIVWGTASLVFLLSWGEGLRRMLEDGFTRIGRDMVVVWAGRIGEQYTPAADRRYLWFTREDAEALGCVEEVNSLHSILQRGTSAHRQIKKYELEHAAGASDEDALKAVVDRLIKDTAAGL